MKKTMTLALLWAFSCSCLLAQLTIQSGATLTVQGSAEIVLQDLDLDNQGTIEAGSGIITFSGSADNTLRSGGSDLYDLKLDKDASANLSLLDDTRLTNQLTFGGNDNLLIIGAHDLTFGSAAVVSGFDGDNYVVTDGAGEVVKESMTNFNYPVGATNSTYNPITLTETGTADNIGVRVIPDALEGGSNGAMITSGVVNAAWIVTENVAGGSNLSMTAQWAGSDELTGFDRAEAGISRYESSTDGWDLTLADIAASNGGDPYTSSRTGVTEVGVFVVASDTLLNELKLAVDVLLEGPYNASGEMTDFLRTSGNFPLTEPFTGLGFSHVSGGGETIAPAILNNSGSDAIVDWVFIELRTGSGAGTKVLTKSALLQKDGDIVDLDGTSDLTMAGMADGNYFLVVRHRNHLGIQSINSIGLTNAPTSQDYMTTDGGVLGTNLSMTDLGDGFYALFSGDFDGNGQIQNTDNNAIIPTIGLAGYLQGDMDLNNQVQNTDLQLLLIPNIGRGIQFNY